MVLTSLSHVLLHGKRHPWFMFSSVIVLFHCHTFLIFVLRSFQICCMVFFFLPFFLIFKYLDWCSPPFFFFFNFILKFICCQFAACLFFGISLIKYFLFSPLSPWLLTLLPTLTIVCCGKFLLVEFFFFFCFLLPLPLHTPFYFWFFSVEIPVSFYQQAMPTAGCTPCVPGRAALPTTSLNGTNAFGVVGSAAALLV